MGYEVERFIHPVDDEYLCSICLGVFESPVHGPCGHTFCSKCIENWIPVNVNTCPLDKKPLRKADLISVSLPFRNLLNRLEIRCEFEPAGCTHISQIAKLPAHVRLCPFNPDGEVICDQGCGLTYLRKDKEDHKCISALKELVNKQKLEIAELTKKVNNNKRTYDSAFSQMSRLFSTGSNERISELLSDEEYARRARDTALEVRRRALARARTPPPSNPRLISQLSSTSRLLPSTSFPASSSSSGVGVPSSSSNLPTLTSRLGQRRDAVTGGANMESHIPRFSRLSMPTVVVPDLPNLQVQLERLTDEDLEYYGVARPRPFGSRTPTGHITAHQSSSLQPTSSGLDASGVSIGGGGSAVIGGSTGAVGGVQMPSSSSPSSSSSSASSSPTQGSGSPSSTAERFNLLSAMLSRGSGCSTLNG